MLRHSCVCGVRSKPRQAVGAVLGVCSLLLIDPASAMEFSLADN